KSYGVDYATAKHLIIQMISGSASMLEQTQDPATLREQVTTPGGSTAEDLKALDEYNFSEAIQKAVEATNKKARGK
ncbi:pyrroline-5-carboxylate reductase family protein, partial [Bacillus nitratireducens]|uniref:pyrroline-5-carboxylate reductase family protein n=1 Tax=Bacillus nitratireducens TaxID=2026193 RepID=UPI002848D5F6